MVHPPCFLSPLADSLLLPFRTPLYLLENPPSCDRIRPPWSQVACKLTSPIPTLSPIPPPSKFPEPRLLSASLWRPHESGFFCLEQEVWYKSLPDRLAEVLRLQSHVPVLYKKKATLLATIWKQICESYRILIFHQAMSHVVPDLKWKHFCAYLSSVTRNSEFKIRMNWIPIVSKTARIIFLCIYTVL